MVGHISFIKGYFLMHFIKTSDMMIYKPGTVKMFFKFLKREFLSSSVCLYKTKFKLRKIRVAISAIQIKRGLYYYYY